MSHGGGLQRSEYTELTAHEDDPRPTAMAGNYSIRLELLVGGISCSLVVKRQHKRAGETTCLTRGFGAALISQNWKTDT